MVSVPVKSSPPKVDSTAAVLEEVQVNPKNLMSQIHRKTHFKAAHSMLQKDSNSLAVNNNELDDIFREINKKFQCNFIKPTTP